MTVPVFLETDDTAFDNDRALTAEHGRRLIRNALAIWNERCGHVGYSERLVSNSGAAISTRVIITANWAYHGPIYYYCPAPVGQRNQARQTPFVRLLLTGRATGLTSSYVYAINESLRAPAEPEMDSDILGAGTQWATINTADWSVTLEIPVMPGWNKIWLGWKCGLYGEPVSLTQTIGPTVYLPYLGSLNTYSSLGIAGSHPGVLGANVLDTPVPPFAISIAVNPANRNAGNIQTYTCPMIMQNPGKDPLINDGMYLLWEPFKNQLDSISESLVSDTDAIYSLQFQIYISAFRQSLDVINLDSFSVDGSQVWQIEDNDGAGLRWFQLPSALQYRQAANLAESARRAVCPMVSIGSEVVRPVSAIPYPLAGSPKAYSWHTELGTTGVTQYALLSLDSLPPFQIPDDTVTLEYCLGICVVSEESLQSVRCIITAEIRNWATGVAITQNVASWDIIPISIQSGSVSGYSILSRTITWSYIYSKLPNAFCDYGQEGLTLRGDFQRWQEVRGTISIPRASLPTDPVIISVTPVLSLVLTAENPVAYITQSQLSVRIAGQ